MWKEEHTLGLRTQNLGEITLFRGFGTFAAFSVIYLLFDRPSMLNSSSCETSVGSLVGLFQISHNILMEFKSGLCLIHSMPLHFFLQSHSIVDLLACGSLSRWKTSDRRLHAIFECSLMWCRIDCRNSERTLQYKPFALNAASQECSEDSLILGDQSQRTTPWTSAPLNSWFPLGVVWN